MTSHAERRPAGPEPPALLLVDADERARAVTESALTRRYGADYQVLAAGTPQDGFEALERLATEGTPAALVAVDLRLPGMDGLQFLERAHELHPRSLRALLVAMDQFHTRVPFTE
ncbi:MAG: hypothetical protein J2P45_02830, partial [Candidatus Dormibacteraeota bacterium]|nr:hypothetical protein [Candidatus Dormibacteraeota bacterium]